MEQRKVLINTGSWWRRPDYESIRAIMETIPDGQIIGFGQEEPNSILGILGGPGPWYLIIESKRFTPGTSNYVTTSYLKATAKYKAALAVAPPDKPNPPNAS